MVTIMSIPWLVITRSLAILSLFAVLAHFLLVGILGVQQVHGYGGFIPLAVFSMLWLPYLGAIWNLRLSVRSNLERVKSGLALAVSWGTYIFMLSGFLCFKNWSGRNPDWRVTAFTSSITLLQICLVTGSIKTYYSMERDPDDFYILATRSLMAVAATVLTAMVIPPFVHNP